MAGQIRLTPEQLREMAGRYGQKGGEIESIIGELDGMIAQLEGEWEGASSRAFANQYQDLKPSFVKMRELLEDIKNQLTQVAHSLESTDQSIASQIGR